jgi:hypothetical protein
MGYTTEFAGRFNIVNNNGQQVSLDEETASIIKSLSDNDTRNLAGYQDKWGHFDCKDIKFSIGDVNFDFPEGFYSYYCQWVLGKDNSYIEWDGNEKFYEYEEWLNIILKKILVPRGYYLSGEVRYQGEEMRDIGFLIAEPNAKSIKKMKLDTKKYIKSMTTDTLEMQKLLSWLNYNYPEIIDEYHTLMRCVS